MSKLAYVARLIQSFEKRFVGTCITLAALWATDHLAELPKYTNYAYAIGLVVIIVGILGRKQDWAKKYRKYVFEIDSWLLGAIALFILGISAEKQLDVFNGSGLSWFKDSWSDSIAHSLSTTILAQPLHMKHLPPQRKVISWSVTLPHVQHHIGA